MTGIIATLSAIALVLSLYTAVHGILEDRKPSVLVADFAPQKTRDVHEFFAQHEGDVVDLQIRVQPDESDQGPRSLPRWQDLAEDRRAAMGVSAAIEPGPDETLDQVQYIIEVIQISATPEEASVVYFPTDTVGGWEIKGRFHVDRVYTQEEQYITALTPQAPG